MKLNELKDKRILILGFGKEGKDTLRFLRKLFPEKIFGVGDSNKNIKSDTKKVRWHLGKNYLKFLKNYNTIIKSPGIPIHLPEIKKAFKEGKITSQTEIFFDNCSGKIIGVTGTKGKGTTSLLIYKILKEGGIKVHLVGNIGKPALSFLHQIKPDDFIIYELSSHQLYKIKKSPQIAVLLNIYPAHLDYFKNFKEYINSKFNITRYQRKNDYLIYNSEDKIVFNISKRSKARLIKIPKMNFDRIKTSLIGDFNFFNISTAITIAKIFGIKNEIIAKVVKNFRNQPHRLEYLGKFKEMEFYDDSASTIPESTIGAIKALKKNLQTIILGGFENNVSFKKLAQEIIKSKIKNLIFFPTTGKKIWKRILQIKKNRIFNSFFVNNMAEAVKIAYSQTKKGEICLLSPSSQSFNLFTDYKERGNLFKKYVKNFSKIKNGKKRLS